MLLRFHYRSATIISYLQAAEEHVANVELEIATSALLVRAGDGTVRHEQRGRRVTLMEQTHMQYIGDRDRLRTELAVLTAADAAKAQLHRDPRPVGLITRPLKPDGNMSMTFVMERVTLAILCVTDALTANDPSAIARNVPTHGGTIERFRVCILNFRLPRRGTRFPSRAS